MMKAVIPRIRRRLLTPTQMAASTLVNGVMAKNGAKAGWSGQMAPSTKVTGGLIEPMAEEGSYIWTVMFTRANG